MSTTSHDHPDWLSGPSGGNAILTHGDSQTITAGNTAAWGPFLVGNAPAILLTTSVGANLATTWQVNWLVGPNANDTVVYDAVLHKAGDIVTEAVLPVWGPYVYLTVKNDDATSSVDVAPVVALGPTGSGAVPPLPPQVLIAGEQDLGAGASVNLDPSIMRSGRAMVAVTSDNAAVTWALQRWDGSAWDYYQLARQAAGVYQPQPVNLPLDDWRLAVTNQGTAAETVFWGLAVDA